MSKWDLESPFRPILLRSWHAGNECQEGLECLGGHFSLEDGEDLAWLFMLSSNRAKKWFNAIFDSKLTPEYSYKMIFLKRETFCWKISDRIFIKNSVTTVVIVDLWLLIIWDPFRPIWSRSLSEKDGFFAPNGQSRIWQRAPEQQNKFCLQWSRRVRMGPKGS